MLNNKAVMTDCHFPNIQLSSAWLTLNNSHKWSRQNFSLQYQHNIKQMSDKNKDKYLLAGDYYPIPNSPN